MPRVGEKFIATKGLWSLLIFSWISSDGNLLHRAHRILSITSRRHGLPQIHIYIYIILGYVFININPESQYLSVNNGSEWKSSPFVDRPRIHLIFAMFSLYRTCRCLIYYTKTYLIQEKLLCHVNLTWNGQISIISILFERRSNRLYAVCLELWF